MARTPEAEFAIDDALVRALLRQAPQHAHEPLRKVAAGWDCEIWRSGPDVAVRVPRRALSAPLIAHEAEALPRFAAAVRRAGVEVPEPLFTGQPDAGFPWRWSIVPWIDGDSGIDVVRETRSGWAETLAAALGALHVAAPEVHPVNPVRGRPLVTRAPAIAERLAHLREVGLVETRLLDAAEQEWQSGLAATEWRGPGVWIHGDLHPGNLVAEGPHLRGIIDFGDVTAGDPAYDLAIAWLAFDPAGRDAFVDATGARYDRDTWVRARAWAAATGITLAAHSDDNPRYGAMALEALHEVSIA